MTSRVEARFKGISAKKKGEMLLALRVQSSAGGGEGFDEEDLETFLTMVSADFFRRLFRVQVKATRGSYQKPNEFVDFLDRKATLQEAKVALARFCIEGLTSWDEGRRLDVLKNMADLSLLHPVLWLAVYRRVKALNSGEEKGLEGPGSRLRFRQP